MTTVNQLLVIWTLVMGILALGALIRLIQTAEQSLRNRYVPDARNEAPSNPQEATNDGSRPRPQERNL